MVIQRWQSVMLLIACVMMGIFSFISLGQIQTAEYTFNITTIGICREGIATEAGEAAGVGTIYILVISLLAAVLPLIGIICFKNTKLQKKVALISMLCAVLATLQSMYVAIDFASGISGATTDWSVFIAAPVLAVLAEIAAYRMIRSDERKLRAADRLR